MKWQQFIKDYLFFSKKERNAVIILILVIATVAFLPQVYRPVIKSKPLTPEQQSFLRDMEQYQRKEKSSSYERGEENNSKGHSYAFKSQEKANLFYFDPNTLSPAGWKLLGVRDRTVQTIQKYLSKGGKFRKPEDLKNIYGLRQEESERLVPYVRISSSNPYPAQRDEEVRTPTKIHFDKPVYKAPVLDINTADLEALVALPGIGEKLAGRIINFREKLGGFHSLEQVGETYGLPDSTFQKILPRLKIGHQNIHRININTVVLDDLKKHPYIKWNIANALIQYRKQHGNYSSVEEIKGIDIITPEIFQKISPYLAIE